MSQVDLSTLRGPELRQLLDTTRRRGQAQASYEILREMAARRERNERDKPKARSSGKRPSEPRTIEVALGDPLEREDEFAEDLTLKELPPEDLPPEPQLAAHWDDPAPEPEEATFLDRPRQMPPQPKPRPPKRRWGWVLAALLFGLSTGGVLGWSLNEIARDLRPSPAAVAALTPPAAPSQIQTAPLAPAAPANADPNADPSAISPAAAPDATAASASGSPPAEAHAPPAGPAPPAAVETAQDNAAVPTPSAPIPAVLPEGKKAKPPGVAAAVIPSDADAAPGAKGCAAQPTPADRTICGDPRLQRLQRDLRAAYADALDAHQDRDLLRERQLAWRDARSDIADPDRLAKLYEERIRKLNAAAAEARAQR